MTVYRLLPFFLYRSCTYCTYSSDYPVTNMVFAEVERFLSLDCFNSFKQFLSLDSMYALVNSVVLIVHRLLFSELDCAINQLLKSIH